MNYLLTLCYKTHDSTVWKCFLTPKLSDQNTAEKDLALYLSNIPMGFQSFKEKKITSVKSSLWQPHIKYF